MCDLEDIFQNRVKDVLGDIEGIKTYTNDISVFKKIELL